jgi:3-isopropylmalate dehydrogenase
MNSYKLAIIKGDGIGPEVINEGLKVLDAVEKKYKFETERVTFPYGGAHYLKTGEVLPDSAVKEFRKFDAIYLGGIGHPDVKPGILERGILLKLRFDLELYINLRPVKLYENVASPIKNIEAGKLDYVVVRENTGGLYCGEGNFQKKGTKDEVAVQNMVYSYKQVERCVRYAFELAQRRKRNGSAGKVTLCGKTNVLTYVFDLWERVFHAVAKDFPDIKTDYVHVDACCIYMIEDPSRFDVIVTENMFGDIITDLAAVTQGGMGVAPSGNINPKGVSMFEPVHGTAPSFAGKNVINPIAAVLTAFLMLDHLGEKEAAKNIEEAAKKTIKKMKSMLAGKMGMSTSDVGDLVVKNL